MAKRPSIRMAMVGAMMVPCHEGKVLRGWAKWRTGDGQRRIATCKGHRVQKLGRKVRVNLLRRFGRD
jgi:hypothetical protein